MEYLSSMPFPNKVYFSQNDLKVFGLLSKIIKKAYKRDDFKLTSHNFLLCIRLERRFKNTFG